MAIWEGCNEGCIHLWHKRFGHRDSNVIREIANRNLKNGMKMKNCGQHKLACETCIDLKMSRKLFPKNSITKTTNVRDFIHTRGKKYILTITDDFSRLSIIHLLSKKSEVVEKFPEYVRLVDNKSCIKPKIIRSNRGASI